MLNKNVVILDGTRSNDNFDELLELLFDVLRQNKSTIIETFRLRYFKIEHCIGCFDCWFKNPGRCIYTDAVDNILQRVLDSDTVIFFTPLVFGGYSSELKKIMDRFLPLILPFFTNIKGETHHLSRYGNIPRFVGIGISHEHRGKSALCFQTLVGRNAINYHASSFSADVVSSLNSRAAIRSQFQNLLSRKDRIPFKEELSFFIKENTIQQRVLTKSHNALLLIGSPKIKALSTSAVVGNYLLERLRKNSWTTKSITFGQDLLYEAGRNNLCSAVDKAEIIIIVFPLYVDSLPFLTTRALEIIYSYNKIISRKSSKRVLAVVHSGFPEAYQNTVALTICRNFVIQCGMSWAGGLAMGGGEALELYRLPKYFSTLSCSFLHHIMCSLNMTAAALAEERPIPQKAIRLIAQTPLPFISFDIWRFFFTRKGSRLWKKKAAENGVTPELMFARPYTSRTDNNPAPM